MSPKVDEALAETLHSGYIGQGDKVREFEFELANHFGMPYILAVNSCTSAIQLALHLVKTQEGEPVLLPPLSCFATTSAVIANGMVPRWVDIDPATCNMDLNDLRQKLTPETKIILLVHYAGLTPNYNELDYILDEFQRKHDFRPYVIEDCAQSLGSRYEGRNIGFYDSIVCLSFQSVKLLTTGDGGAISLPYRELYERAKLLRWYGLNREENIRFQNIQESGFKYHMNDITATIGLCNLWHISNNHLIYEQTSRHDHIAYALGQSWEFGHVCCGQYPVVVPDRHAFERNLANEGIECFPAHYRCDTHDCVKAFRTHLPGMDQVERQMTMVPCGWWVSYDDLNRIIDRWKKNGF